MKSKILKITGITLFILATFVWAAPWLVKGKINHLLRAQINKDLKAHVSYSGLDISLFRHFPKISIGLDNLQVICVGEFQGDTLITAKQFDIACDMASLFSGDSIRVHSFTINEPRLYARIHADGHTNWNIIRQDAPSNENIDSSSRPFEWQLHRYAIHNGYLDYTDEKRNLHIVVNNVEHAGIGNFSSGLFALKTRTTADAIQFNYNGTIPCRLSAKTSIDMAFNVDNRTHTWSFNTDQLSFNDMKLHAEGFFQWINDSSYNMNIKYKLPSTNFKNFLSMLPSVYSRDFASIESNGQVNFNGFVKGKYDENHSPAYHTNLYVLNGYFKYPDLPVAVENINLGFQVDNPDGMADHTTINLIGAHAEINNDTLDLHLMVKNLRSKPFIDFAFVGKLDLANISKWMKPEPGTSLSGLLTTDIHAKGNIPESEKQKKDIFKSWGDFDLSDFSYTSNNISGGIILNELCLEFNPKNVLMKELRGQYLNTHITASGSLNNLFDYALRNSPLNASMDVRTDELNLREWVGTGHALVVPENINFAISVEAGKLHYDNLDLQNLSGKMIVADQTVQLHNVKAGALDGEIAIEGTYSTLESKENPEIAFIYDVKGLDIQKAFFAFNTARKIMPVAKFMAGNLNAHMTLGGRLNDDMTTNLATLQGEGTVQLLMGSLKDFGPLDKLSQSLDITGLKDIPLKDVKADFTFKSGKVVVSPFLVHANDMDMLIGGTHGFDQSLDYDVSLRVPRSQLGSKGSMFVKNVVEQAADKGIPVKLSDAVNMNVKMCGTINSPDVNADMNTAVSNAATDLNKEVNDFVNAKLDSAKQQLRNPPSAGKKQLFVQTVYKSKSNSKVKKHSKTVHKSTAHSKSKKKKKKSTKHYTASLTKDRSTAGNVSRKHSVH